MSHTVEPVMPLVQALPARTRTSGMPSRFMSAIATLARTGLPAQPGRFETSSLACSAIGSRAAISVRSAGEQTGILFGEQGIGHRERRLGRSDGAGHERGNCQGRRLSFTIHLLGD